MLISDARSIIIREHTSDQWFYIKIKCIKNGDIVG